MSDADDYLEDPNLYFGNADKQRQLLSDLNQSVHEEKSALHIVSGGTMTGKSSTIRTFVQQMDANPNFVRVESLSNRDIPASLANMLTQIHRDGEPTVLFKRKDTPYYVAVPDGLNEMPLEFIVSRHKLSEIANTLRKIPSKEYGICCVVDSPVLNQKPSILKPDAYAVKSRKEHDKHLRQFLNENGDLALYHEMPYDVAQIRDAIWQHAQRYGIDFFIKIEDDFVFTDGSPEWKKAKDAALDGNRFVYDKAFDVLEKRALTRNKGTTEKA